MSETNRIVHGDFQRTPDELLRHALGTTEPDSWKERVQDGLSLAISVFREPALEPMFYSHLTDKSLALALASSIYSEEEFRKARESQGTVQDAKLKVLGFHTLAMAMAESPEIEQLLGEADPSAFAAHVPFATGVMSQSREERDLILDPLHEHRSLRGMFVGVGEICKDAIDATKDPKKLIGHAEIVLRGRPPITNQEDRDKGIVFANGYDALLIAAAAHLGYITEPEARPAELSKPGESQVFYFSAEAAKKPKPATPPEFHWLAQTPRHEELGIYIPQARETAAGNSEAAVEALDSEDTALLHVIRGAVIEHLGTFANPETLDGIEVGSTTVALGLANASGTKQSNNFVEVLQSLDLLVPKGLRGSEELDAIVASACKKAEAAVKNIREKNHSLTQASASLGLRRAPLLASMCEAVNGDLRNYADITIEWQAQRALGNLAGAYASLEVWAGLLDITPRPQSVKKAA